MFTQCLHHQGGEGNRCISLVVALVTRQSPAIRHTYNAAGAKTLFNPFSHAAHWHFVLKAFFFAIAVYRKV